MSHTPEEVNEKLEAIYKKTAAKLQEIVEHHRQEIDAYIKELEDAKRAKLEQELKS